MAKTVWDFMLVSALLAIPLILQAAVSGNNCMMTSRFVLVEIGFSLLRILHWKLLNSGYIH